MLCEGLLAVKRTDARLTETIRALEAALVEARRERDDARAVSMAVVRERNDFEQRVVEVLDEVRDLRQQAVDRDRRGYERAREEALAAIIAASSVEHAFARVVNLKWGHRRGC